MKYLRAALLLDAISRHRAVLYGVAALWLMFLHIPAGGASEGVFGWLKYAGSCGVEVFVLLSPMGLYRSLAGGRGYASFYRHRLLRVALPAFAVAALFRGIDAGGAREYALSLTFFAYWFGETGLWYVGFILTMYALYPALYALGRRAPRALWALFAASVPLTLAAHLALPEWMALCCSGVDRVPAFLLGCALAPRLAHGGRVPRWSWLTALALCALLAGGTFTADGVRSFWLLAMCNLLLAAALLPPLAALADWLARGAARRYLYRLLAMAGAVSLEIYLLYSRVYTLLGRIDVYQSGTASADKRILAALALTPLCAAALRALCRAIERFFRNAEVPERKPRG